MEQLYVLETIEACPTRLYAGGGWVNDTRPRCAACGAFMDAFEPQVIEIALMRMGQHGFAEYLWNSHGLPIFREDLIQLWQDNGLTGFELKPVRIVGWYNKPRKPLPERIPRYFRLVTKSKVRLTEPLPLGEPCPECGSIRYAFPKLSNRLPNGFAIDPTTWDGADICGLEGYEFLFCTRRLAEITLKAGYNRHVAFVRTQDYRRWEEFNVADWTFEAHKEYVETFLIRAVERL